MRSVRPTLYLDVDGVLLPAGTEESSEFSWSSTVDGARWAPEMTTALAALPATRVWLTTWREEANTFLCPRFGWEPLEVCPRRPEVTWWKFEALLRHHADGPFVWIDDELTARLAENSHIMDRLDYLGVPYLLVSPTPRQGLSRAELGQVAEFMALHR